MRHRGRGQALCKRARGVREATTLAPTEAPLVRAQPIDTYHATLLRGGGLGPRSLVLHPSQYSHPTDSRASHRPHDDLCRCCAINTAVKTRETPAPRGTRVGCKVTGVPQAAVVYCTLYMFSS